VCVAYENDDKNPFPHSYIKVELLKLRGLNICKVEGVELKVSKCTKCTTQ
jgi:hypothetical protein